MTETIQERGNFSNRNLRNILRINLLKSRSEGPFDDKCHPNCNPWTSFNRIFKL